MRAMVLSKQGEPLELRELERPEPGHGELRVEVAACGICRTDLHVVDGDLREPALPLVPGHQIVGRVEAFGSGVDELGVEVELDAAVLFAPVGELVPTSLRASRRARRSSAPAST